MRPASQEEIAHWDELVAARGKAASILQGSAFAQIKSEGGWQPEQYVCDQIPILALRRRIIGHGDLYYLPGGPMVDSVDQLATLLPQLGTLKGFLVQFDPELPVENQDLAQFRLTHHLGTRPPIQPNVSTVLVDLSGSEEEIIGSFHSKTRYNVRLAERKGVVVTPAELTDESVEQMYRLMRSSQDRGGYYLRPKAYFERAWRIYVENGNGQMFFARFEGQVLAGVFVTYLGVKALYKDGGSTREHREIPAMAYLQWEAMRWLKQQGVTIYDLHGVPPADRIGDPTHPFAGLARFKTGFASEITSYTGVIDLPLNQAAYNRWRKFGERVYATMLYRVKRRSIY